MSTRSTTHFVSNGKTEAIIYRHSDGYPEGHGMDLSKFFEAVEEQTKDTRFSDPSYLAAKLVVWLADRFAQRFEPNAEGEYGYVKSEMLDFISVGVVMKDPIDIEYLYEVDCSELRNGYPAVRCYEVGGGWGGKPKTRELVAIPTR